MKVLVPLAAALLLSTSAIAQVQLHATVNGIDEALTIPNSDCNLSIAGTTASIVCPVLDYSIDTTKSPYTIITSNWGGLMRATGGGTVAFILPKMALSMRGKVLSFLTDCKTSFVLTTQPGPVMQGSPMVVNNQVAIPACGNGWIQYDGTNYNVAFNSQ